MKSLLTGLVFMAALTVSAQENIQWRGTDRSGIYHETGLLSSWPEGGPALLWHYDGLGDGHSSVAIDSDKIYLTGMTDSTGHIYVFDFDGKLVARQAYGPEWDESYEGPRGTITVSGGRLYLVSGRGELYCYDQSSLNLVWKKNLLGQFDASNITWGINEAPLVVGNMVIATPGGKRYNVVALNRENGELIWSCEGEGDQSAYCSPLYIADQEVPQIVTLTANHVIGIEASTGKKLWSFPNANRHSVHANTPVYGNGMILCTSGYGRGSTMLRLTDGGRSVEQVWFAKELDNRIGAMVKVGDYAYGSGDNNRFWFCVDWNTGEIKYQERGQAMGNVIANNDMLYCYTDRGDVILAKATPEKFDIAGLFRVTLGTAQHWAHPVIYGGVLYVRHGNTLMAYKIR
jgi:outer membrane protein assembly factor BamB